MSKEIKEEQHDWVESAAQDSRLLSNMQDSYADGRDLANQMLGQIQMSMAISKFTDVVSLQKLKHIKETKMYRAVAGQKGRDRHGNEIPDVGTFDGFCRALGTSASKVDEDLKNLEVFGEDALEQLTRIGAGYREMRQYRRLDEDQKLMLIEAAKTGDKEGFIDLAEELISKHAREKAELEKKLSDVTADHEAQGKVLADKSAKIDALSIDLHKATKLIEEMTPDEEDRHMQEQVAGVAYNAEIAIRGDLRRAVEAVMERSAQLGQNPRAYLSGALLQLERAIHEIRVEHDIPAKLDGDTRPYVARMDQE